MRYGHRGSGREFCSRTRFKSIRVGPAPQQSFVPVSIAAFPPRVLPVIRPAIGHVATSWYRDRSERCATDRRATWVACPDRCSRRTHPLDDSAVSAGTRQAAPDGLASNANRACTVCRASLFRHHRWSESVGWGPTDRPGPDHPGRDSSSRARSSHRRLEERLPPHSGGGGGRKLPNRTSGLNSLRRQSPTSVMESAKRERVPMPLLLLLPPDFVVCSTHRQTSSYSESRDRFASQRARIVTKWWRRRSNLS